MNTPAWPCRLDAERLATRFSTAGTGAFRSRIVSATSPLLSGPTAAGRPPPASCLASGPGPSTIRSTVRGDDRMAPGTEPSRVPAAGFLARRLLAIVRRPAKHAKIGRAGRDIRQSE
jgi:hypothetical protein